MSAFRIHVRKLGGDVDAAPQAAGHGAVVGVEPEHPVDLGSVDVLAWGKAVSHPYAFDDEGVALELDLADSVRVETTVSSRDAPSFQGTAERAGQSSTRRGHDVVESGGVWLVLALGQAVVFGDLAVHTERDALVLGGQGGVP